jgi:uncharacterized repeat protein (TIGR02059 family)
VAVSGDTVTLILAAPVAATDTVTVSYAKPSGSRLRGVDGDARDFSGRSVTNLVGALPSVSQTAITSTPAATGGAYAPGETVQVSLTFTEAVTVTGTPRLKLKLAPNYGEKWANYASGSGSATLVFNYTVAEPDRSTRGVAVLRDGLDLNGGSIRSATQKDTHRWYPGLDYDPDHMVDWRRSDPGVPWMTGVAITSDPGPDDTYALGDTISVKMTFSEAVNVNTTGGTPRLKIRMARNDRWWKSRSAEKWLSYSSGSGTAELTFSYTVQEGDVSTGGIAVLGNTLELNGGVVRSTTATPVNAHLRHEGLRHDQQHRVDGLSPPLQGVVVNGTTASVSFNELLDANSVPPASAFTVKRTPATGAEETVSLSGAPAIRGGAVILTLANAVLATDTNVKLSYSPPSSGDRLRDRTGNHAAGFSDQAADAADATPPTLVRGEIDGDVMTIIYSEPLNEESVSIGRGQGDHFRMQLDYQREAWRYGYCPRGSITFTAKPTDIIVSGNAVTVVGTLPADSFTAAYRAVVDWTIINFSYVADVTVAKRLRDLAGHPVSLRDDYGDRFWWSKHIYLENVTLLPHPKSVTVNGKQLTMTFSAPLDESSVPAAGAFSVTVNGASVSLDSASPVAVSGYDVTLTLAATVATGDTVTVSYTKPHTKPLKSVLCEPAPSFSDESVTNSTP